MCRNDARAIGTHDVQETANVYYQLAERWKMLGLSLPMQGELLENLYRFGEEEAQRTCTMLEHMAQGIRENHNAYFAVKASDTHTTPPNDD